MSDYWTVSAPWDESESLRVRKCKNGCDQTVYFNEHVSRFCNLNDGEQHDCPNFKKKSSSGSGSSPAKPNNNNNNNSAATATATVGGSEVILTGQLEELRRAVDHLSRIAMFVENIDFRVKKIEESLHYSPPPPRPKLTIDDDPLESEQLEEEVTQ